MGMRTTLLLVLLVAGLVGTLLFTDRKPAENKLVQISALDGRSLATCKRMRWKLGNQAWTEVSRGADGFFNLTEPIVDRASIAYLKQIVVAWDSAQLIATEFQNDAKGQLETGLDAPELLFVVEWPDDHKVQIEVGATGPQGSDRFLRRDGRIYRGGEGVFESMRVGLEDLRERSVFMNTESQCAELVVEQIQPTGKRERLQLVRDQKSGDWRLAAPIKSRTDPKAALQYVTSVLALKVDHFPPGVIRWPDREPDLVIIARGRFGEETVRLWEAQGAIFGQLPGRANIAFTSDNLQYSQIFQSQAQNLRATILLPFDNLPEHLAEILIDPGQGRGDRVHLVRTSPAENWMLAEPLSFATGATPVNELVHGLNNLRVMEFEEGMSASQPPTGLGPGRLQLSVRGFESKELTTLWIGAGTTKQNLQLNYACRADEPESVVLVPAPAADMLRRSWVTYCSPDIVRLAVPISSLVLHRGAETRTFKSNGSHWVLDGAEGNRDEIGGFARDVLRDLRAKAAVDLRGDALGEPGWTLDLCREDGDVLITLRVWDRGKDAPLVVQAVMPKTKPSEVGFEVEQYIAKSLRELWQ